MHAISYQFQALSEQVNTYTDDWTVQLTLLGWAFRSVTTFTVAQTRVGVMMKARSKLCVQKAQSDAVNEQFIL